MAANYRVFPINLQKQNRKIDTLLGAIGAQNLFSSLYKLIFCTLLAIHRSKLGQTNSGNFEQDRH